MSDFETAARPYARAFFEMAREAANLDGWQQRLALVSEIAADAEMKAILERPEFLPRELGELFLSVIDGAGLDADTDFNNAIRLLAENSRLPALPAIAAEFANLKQEADGLIEVRVTSAQPLTDEQQESISRGMARRLGKKVSLTTEVDDSLIAGAVITAGDLVIDGSASGRMEKLALAVNK